MHYKYKMGTVNTISIRGINTLPVQVQVYIGNELPAFIISGLGDKTVSESKERIKSALRCIGFALPAKRIVVNLTPANLPKEGSHYDLPIILAILQAMGAIESAELDEYICMGEIGLNGKILKIPGIFIGAIHAVNNKCGLICPYESGSEAACGGEIKIIPAEHVLDIINHFKGARLCQTPDPKIHNEDPEYLVDFKDVIGNRSTKRAIEIAAAGNHNMMMIGSPGAGKSMIAMRMPTIMPELSTEEIIEISMIHSVAGIINGVKTTRPFRDPHHNTSIAAMLGGGRHCKPGEVSLAHLGVLFMDEITLWPPSILNGLRESMETGYISVSRANFNVQYPAKSQIIAAMNPCPCGNAYEPDVNCARLPLCMQNYMNRVPGPIMDRFPIVVRVNKTNPWENPDQKEESSADIKKRVQMARNLQKLRFKGINIQTNNELISSNDKLFALTSKAENFLLKFAAGKNLSNRKYYHLKRIARTIADLSQSELVEIIHIQEGIMLLGE